MAQTVAAEQLQLEDKLMEAQRLAEQHESAGELRRHREQVVAKLRTEWETMDFADKQELLRDVIDQWRRAGSSTPTARPAAIPAKPQSAPWSTTRLEPKPRQSPAA
jgi:hypothetical protein